MSLYDAVRDLPLVVDGYALDGLEVQARPDFLRKTTVVRLQGGGEEGIGEDVTYHGEEHDAQLERGPVLPLAGALDAAHVLASISPRCRCSTTSRRSTRTSTTAAGPSRAPRSTSRCARRAARSARRSGASARPVSFVVSMGLGEPPSSERVHAWLDLYPDAPLQARREPAVDGRLRRRARRDRLPSTRSTSRASTAAPSSTRRPTRRSTARVADGLPDAWLEDPALTPETEAVLAEHRDRVTWDAIIHSVADIEALPWPPRTVNVKPSRFGSVERLFAAYDYCAARGIGAYGGGQWELGPGRGQIQLLAALFHPDTPNDVAPRDFNLEPQAGLPTSPLLVTPRATGFLALR